MKLIDADRYLAENETVSRETLEKQIPAYIEMDRLRVRAVNDCLKALVPALGIKSIGLTDKLLQMQYDGTVYYVGIRSCSPKAIGDIVRDLIIYGECDYEFTTKQVKRK